MNITFVLFFEVELLIWPLHTDTTSNRWINLGSVFLFAEVTDKQNILLKLSELCFVNVKPRQVKNATYVCCDTAAWAECNFSEEGRNWQTCLRLHANTATKSTCFDFVEHIRNLCKFKWCLAYLVEADKLLLCCLFHSYKLIKNGWQLIAFLGVSQMNLNQSLKRIWKVFKPWLINKVYCLSFFFCFNKPLLGFVYFERGITRKGRVFEIWSVLNYIEKSELLH